MIFDRKSASKSTNYTNQNNPIMLKMVTSYSIFLLTILFLFVVIYHFSLNNTRDSYNSQNETTLVNNVELFETDLHIMEVYCRQLLQNNSYRKIMNKKETDNAFFELGTELQSTMATDIYLESLLPIKDSFSYFPLTNYILNANQFITQERFYSSIQKYPADHEKDWISYHMDSNYHNRFLLFENFSALPGTEWDFYMYIINMRDLFYMDANATVSFIFDSDEFAKLFDCINAEGNGFLMVVAEDGIPILSINEGNSYDEASIISMDYSNGFASYEGRNKITIGKYVSDNTGYSYYYSFPSFENTANTESLRYIFILALLLTLLVGGSLVYYFSRRNIQPIIELGQELHEAVEAQTQLQEVVDSQRPIICTSYIQQLLSGSVTAEEADYIHNYLNLGEKNIYYNVLYVVVYNNSGDNPDAIVNTLSSPDEINELISNALQSYLGTPLHYFSPAERTYSILLCCSEEEEKDYILKISNAISRLHDYMLDTYDIWLFAGIGRNTDSLMNVWESYQQATEATSYMSKNYFFFPYEFIKKDSKAFYYPPEISTKLIHFITTGNKSQVLELFNLIHQENIEERSLPINILKFLLSDIRNTLLKARFALPSSIPAETIQNLDERFNQHVTFKLCEKIAMTLCDLFTVETEDTNLIATIEKYIVSNYMDPSMGLNKISDEFQISESYFSHMFKEKTGVNFSTYLENIRMNEAAKLIKETNISLNELYISVGYNNANTFRRAFKKTYGVTPSSMREGK
ncbi:MAG: helix-turn-helix transcriptional regulator [Lachnospiraceae bacterium]|nr:helix-turn-helix transcriptional regulator [Lachnospiraceae bacterium]